ncbi:MAG: GNAT family N-acetyltransferase [Thermoplasmata archaeon]|nr:GNAT family N-acetyltransferase [Thermoplasmata archaeon]
MDLKALRHPVVLPGRYVDLVPLDRDQLPGLIDAGRDPEIWTFMFSGPGDAPESMVALVDELLRRESAGTDLPFTVLRKTDRVPVGMTRYLNIDGPHDSVEVGGSWLTPSLWRTPFNTDAKRRMLGHAFEVARAHRVQIKTDERNLRSQRAIERLGAVREGVLRGHMRTPPGFYRSSVFYSVLEPEWPAVRARLDAELERPWPPSA